jgi:preprotein translocase subunit SecY
MTVAEPPRLGTWLLTRFAAGNHALVGDVIEEYRRRRSVRWFWGQVVEVVLAGSPRMVLLTWLVVALYVGGIYIRIPTAAQVVESLQAQRAIDPGPWKLFSVFFFDGGQLAWGSVFTLGIGPYVSAAFLVQFVEIVWIGLSRRTRLRRRLPVARATWWVAIVLCVTDAGGFAAFLERVSLTGAVAIVATPGWAFRMVTILTLTAGTMCLMLLSEQIAKRQMGNGMLVVFLASTFTAALGTIRLLLSGAMDPVALATVLTLNTAIVVIVSFSYRRAIVRELLA